MDRGFERIEIDDYQVDGGDVFFLHRAQVADVIAAAEDTTEDFRVKRLYASIHHLGKTRDLGHFDSVNTVTFEVAPCSTRTVDLHTCRGQSGGEVDQPKFIAAADDSPADA